ncbi:MULTISPECIES: 2OG-Fe(II) oxygenase [unclassified Caulobacter]|uniref:2OG-Fe(II) oxygenase n=1 Tax=unclassified Caulobacter TaxID=2648921 RepID=UPI000D3B6ADB|nr:MULTISPECIES: 2OG-Fe(II) oxygenase [unclassified Caulobacter]PTS91784.1 proline hydroxylase [Caulobacter sp. HMWF009]PTT04734.1 proline hydroxylase [Caulobacter sp. HMWF025]
MTLDWTRIAGELDARGWALTGPLLTPATCADLAGLYGQESLFRSRVVMGRHGFGRGEYQYFRYPLPDPVQALRESLYPPLAGVANRWAERLGQDQRYPETLDQMLARCHAAGQVRPTPLMLTYGPGDYNCLHQDLYGEHVFPLQAAILLDAPGRDFEGGEFVLVEQRPRQQSAPQVVPIRQGEAVIFAVRDRPAEGTRGVHRRILRHGVSEIRSGRRRTLGLIFHDAT